MTRAKQKLCILQHSEKQHKFIKEILKAPQQNFEIHDVNPEIGGPEIKAAGAILWDMTLGDVFISYPAFKGVHEKSQPCLAVMEPGHFKGLTLRQVKDNYTIFFV